MIITRRPWTLFDVDVLGAAVVLLMGVAAWWSVWRPWRQTWADYRAAVVSRAAVTAKLEEEQLALREFEQNLAPLQDTIAAQFMRIPAVSSFSSLLRQLTDVAHEVHLELLSVEPQPMAAQGTYLVSDIQVGARGRSGDFVRFLDRLAQENPYQTLRLCSIQRPATAETPNCNLTWTIRMYLLASPEARAGAGS